jgi:flagella basal body P-ring formation protein FlgA
MIDGKRMFLLVALALATRGVGLIGSVPVRASEEVSSLTRQTVLQIHLPREVTVQDTLLILGQVSVVRGDPALAATAGQIGLGRLSVPGQKVVLDRVTILSRLASSGIPAPKVRLTGAETVTIRRHQKTISSDEFIEAGKTFLRQHPPGPLVHEVVAVGRPKDLVLPGPLTDLQLTPRFVRNGARGYVSVQIAVAANGQEVGVREIPFRLRYQCRRAVTLREVPEGTVLTPENVKIDTTVSDQPEPAGWQPPYGLVATRALAADTEIRRDMLGSAQSPLVIRRNETVVIRVERPGLLVMAVGTALQEARTGEYVKVRNADSSRVIVCKVNADGTVEPML